MFKFVNQLVCKVTFLSMALGLAPQMASAGMLGALHSVASHAAKASAGISLAKHGAASHVASSLASHKPNVSQFAHSASSAISHHAGDINRQAVATKLHQVSSAAQTNLNNKLGQGSPSGVSRLLQAANGQNTGNKLTQHSPSGLSRLLQTLDGQNPAGGVAGAGGAAGGVGGAAGGVGGAMGGAVGNAMQNTPPIINVNVPSLGGGFGGFGGRFGGGYGGYGGGYGGGYNNGYYSQPASTMVADATPATTTAPATSDVTPASYTTPVDTTGTSTIPASNIATTPSTGTPDLVVEDIHLAEPATLLVGPAYRVTFRNQGMGSTGPFRVGLFAVLDNNMTGSQAIVDVIGMAAGQMAEVTLRLPQSAMRVVAANGQTTSFNRLAVSVDSEGTVNETDRSNNAAIVDRAAVEAAH